MIGLTSFGKGSAQNVYPLSSGGALRLTIARWYTPLGRGINRTPAVDAEGEPELDTGVVALPDTIRPRFRTDAGRTVFGGGGITPDVVVGDTVLPLPVQALARAMGRNLGAYRDALARQAQVQRPSVKSPNDPVTIEMLNAVYADLERRQVAPPRAIFNAATPWVSRALGYEMTRVAFGNDAEFLRRMRDDEALRRASRILQEAHTPGDVFKGTAITSVSVPPRP